MTKYVLAFDPGVSTGVSLLKYSESEPASLVTGWQFGGGIGGLLDWLMVYYDEVNQIFTFEDFDLSQLYLESVSVVCEKFTPIPGRGFSQGLDSTLPLVGEGVLVGRGVMPPYDPSIKRWQRPQQMYVFGGASLAEKKKIARAKLKEHGLYLMPRELGTPDSDDFMSATLHALYYITHTAKNRPTYEEYFEIK